MVDEVVAELNRFILKKQQDYNTQRLQTILENKPEMNLIADLSPDRRKALLAANPDLNLHPGLTDDERDAFRRASLPVREQYIEMVGQEGQRLLSRLKRAVAAAEKRLQESPSRTDPEQEAGPSSAVQQNGDSAAESSGRL